MAKSKKWMSYEAQATKLLPLLNPELGVSTVEGKQLLTGITGAVYEVDAVAVDERSLGSVLVEIKRYPRRRINQGIACELAFRIIDTKAAGGIFVSPLGLQRGAVTIAEARNIKNVLLDSESTDDDFYLRTAQHAVGCCTDSARIADEVFDNVVRAALATHLHQDAADSAPGR